MLSNTAEIAIEAPLTSNPLDVIPNEIPFDVPYGLLERTVFSIRIETYV